MTALSLFILCIIVSHHVLSNESILLWYISVIVEALLFVYSYFHYYWIIIRYLCMFDVFKPTLTGFIGTLSPIELGLFESTDIVAGDVFFYLLRFFIRIMIGVSRISYIHVHLHAFPYSIEERFIRTRSTS